jgi:hypothetical protein
MTATESTPLSERFSRIQRVALLIGVAGLALCSLQLRQNPTAFFQSYLFAFLFWNGLVVGSLGIMLMHNVTGGNWGVVIRRIVEACSRLLPVMAILLLPVIIGLAGWHELYIWSRPEIVAHDKNIQFKTAWLNIPFWVGRAAFYFAVWTFWAWRLNRLSAEQDRTADSGIQDRMRRFSAPGLLLFVITATFAYVDWIMSLEPQWFSTMFGAMFLIGQVLETLAFAVVLLYLLSPRRPFLGAVKTQHYWDLGNLLLAFTMLWAYLSFSQFLIIWSGNLPQEIPWYIRRFSGGWGVIAVFVSLFHFGVPFFILLMRFVKKNPRLLYLVAAWLFVVRIVDLYWIVVPGLRQRGYAFEWSDIVAPIGIGGIWIAAFIWQFRKRPLLPLHDARLVLAAQTDRG